MTKINVKITHLKCHLNLPGANELTDKIHMGQISYIATGHLVFKYWLR